MGSDFSEIEKKQPHPTLVEFKKAMEEFDWKIFQSADTQTIERARKKFNMNVISLYIQAKRHEPALAKQVWNDNIQPPYMKDEF